MSRVQHTEQIDAPVEAVFAFVDDYRNTTKYTSELSRWRPVDIARTHGKGATFDLAMTAGPMKIESTVEMNKWVENREIAWHSIRGSKLGGSWLFKPAGGGTAATLTLEYELPGGIAGRIIARGAEPVMRSSVERSVKRMGQLALKQAAPPVTRSAGPGKAVSARKATATPAKSRGPSGLGAGKAAPAAAAKRSPTKRS